MKTLLHIISCIIVASAFPLTACANDISDTEWQSLLAMNAEATKTGLCYVHKTKMEKKAVPIHWGLPGPLGNDEPSTVERMRLFPFAIKYSNGGCCPIPGKETEEVFVCRECQNAEAIWFEQRKQK